MPINTYINANTVESYIEKYPEDTEKWLEFLKPILVDERKYGHSAVRPNDHAEKSSVDVSEMLFTELDTVADLEDTDTACPKCKRTWESTQEHAVIMLLCGHRYHTVCYFLQQYDENDDCKIPNCPINTWDCVRKLSLRIRKRKKKTLDMLASHIRSNADFKNDVKEINKTITEFKAAERAFTAVSNGIKKSVLEKHRYTLKLIQADLNASVSGLKKSPEYIACKSKIRMYRKAELNIYRKYHLSMNEIIRYRVCKKPSWRIRHILMQRGSLMPSKYRFGIRIFPGRNRF